MRFFIAFLFLSTPSVVALSQQRPTPSSYPLSHWSTTGSASQYAPDMDPAEEARLRHDFNLEMKTLDFDSVFSNMKPSGDSTSPHHRYFTPYLLQKSASDPSKLFRAQDSSNEMKLWEPR
jgi:hypothetical protein